MKILFLAGDVNRIGGIEKYNRDFLSALSKIGEKIRLVERYEGGLLAKVSFLLRILWIYLFFRPNYIFCAHLNFSPICFFLEKIFGTPYTLALYGIETIKIQNKFKRKAIQDAKKIITISNYTQSLILKQFPAISEKIFMLPSAVDGSLFYIKKKNSILLKKFNIENRPIILSLARLSTPEHKGQDRVLAAMPMVLEKIPNAIYLIVGNGQDLRVNSILEKNPSLKKNVIFAGAAPDAERVDYYNLGDVYILPSKFEGFGIVFIESLACGVPVIASDGYGCREGLLNGELGRLVPPDDLNAIANAIIEILSKKASPLLFDRENLRMRILSIYGIDAWRSRVERLVEMLRKPHLISGTN